MRSILKPVRLGGTGGSTQPVERIKARTNRAVNPQNTLSMCWRLLEEALEAEALWETRQRRSIKSWNIGYVIRVTAMTDR